MIQDQAIAQQVSDRLLQVNGALDEAVVFVQDNCSAIEIQAFKRAMGEIMYKVFEEALIPIYKEHPILVPEGLRVSGITD
ncbi:MULTISPECIES: hypothetical protein [Paraburkholderia]|jgi:hypothetical protein|uniref:Cytoplasmic protein n=1 Tax=Paraburkholderia graminis TaxID=60548 RepID=A0ABD5CK94_9BURK|nr:hypothetical protein [Paraburkholderia graminis]MDQ0626980.1 hypothetical protein [Paraburkholderia graminis]MDR6205291.1 hypothetical protein [Paraburkholderia graminis]